MQPEVSAWLSSCSSTANATSVKETGRSGSPNTAQILQKRTLFMHAEECLQVAVCVLVLSVSCARVCVCDVTALLPWAGMTPGCSEHNIHIN